MSAFGMIELHDVITRSNGDYCSICFRPALERKLVKPVFLTQFLMNMSRHKYFRKKVKICYVCEALAASAVRFQKAVELGSRVGVLYDDITETGHWQTVVKYLMDVHANNTPKVLAGSIVQRAMAMDKTLRATSRYELVATDTLVVSSVKEKPKPPPPQPPPLQLPPPLSDTVVIVDDDEPAPELQHVRVVNQDTNEIVLHPVMKGSDGNMYVPSLKLQVLGNGLFQGLTDAQMQTSMTLTAVTNPEVINSENQTFFHTTQTQTYNNTERNHNKHSHRRTNEKNEYYNFLLTQTRHKGLIEQQNGVNNVDVIKMNDMNIVLHTDTGNVNNKKRKIPEDPLRIDLPGSTQHGLSDVRHIEGRAVEINYGAIEDDSDHVDRISKGMTESRAPVPRTDQTVDWEDKIPMDVISFMDATDPNPSERIMQPPAPAAAPPAPPAPPAHAQPPAPRALGVISDVRSVPDDAHDHIECIDLC